MNDHTAVLGVAMIIRPIPAVGGQLRPQRQHGGSASHLTEPIRMTVVGNLFNSNGLDRSVNSLAIIISHPVGAVKEQSVDLYATKLAEQGLFPVSVETSFGAGSEGEQRNAVLPDVYSKLSSAAVDYLSTQDRESISVVSICGSGFFVIKAACIVLRVKAVAKASMYDMDAASRNGLCSSQRIEQRKEIIAAAAQQHQIEVDGGRI